MHSQSPLLTVQPAEPTDLQALPAWFASAADLLQWGGPALRFPLDQVQLDILLRESRQTPPARLLWSGRVKMTGEIVAHGQAVLDYDRKTARLARIGIAPAWQGRGLARPFVEGLLEDIARLPVFSTVGLNVYTFNQPAIRLYEGLGFRPDPLQPPPVQIGGEIWQAQPMSRPNRPVSSPD